MPLKFDERIPGSEAAYNHAPPAYEEPDDETEPSNAEISLLRKYIQNSLNEDPAHKLEVIRSDPSSPLYSVKTFEELNLRPELLQGLYSMGFKFPSKIQEAVLGSLLVASNCNILAQSQNGTGKTAAFVLAMLSLIKPNLKFPQALCVAPTLELAVQISGVVRDMSRFMPDVKVANAVRGVEINSAAGVMCHQIIVGTPGTILDWIRRMKVIDPNVIKIFVLDEADVMLSIQGFLDQSAQIMRYVTATPCKIALFSATYNNEVLNFARSLMTHLIEFRLQPGEEFTGTVKQFYLKCDSRESKFNAIKMFYELLPIGKCIIFCRTRASAEWIDAQLKSFGATSIEMLTSNMSLPLRARAIRNFRDGDCRILITTNVIARGIDITGVNIVINYDVPTKGSATDPDFETYLHRIGRTGRFGRSGVAINLVHDEASLSVVEAFCQHFKIQIPEFNESTMKNLV